MISPKTLRVRFPRVCAAALAIPVLACAGADDVPRTERRDSAGIAIIEISAPGPAADGGLVIDPHPEVQIGTLDGPEPYQLFRAGSATRLSDGRIVIADGGTAELRFYDADGRHLFSVGRPGEGPGEFQDLQRVWRLPGDTLLAYDFFPARLSFFDPQGNYLRTIRVVAPDGRQLLVRGAFDDGSLLVQGAAIWGAPGAETGLVRDSVPYYRFDRDGALSDTLGWFAVGDVYRYLTERGWWLTSPAFARNPVAHAAGDRFHYGDADRYEIRSYHAVGDPARVLRLALPPRPVTPADIERFRASRLGDSEGAERAATQQLLRDMPYPREMPAYEALLPGPDGQLWVADYRADPGEERTWRIFSASGDYAGRVVMPDGLHLLEVGRDYVLGRWLDEMDVEHVRLHRLRGSSRD